MPTHWELQDPDATTEDSDDDDLGCPSVARVSTKRRSPVQLSTTAKEDDLIDLSKTASEEESDDEFNNGEAAYKEFKNRKTVQRKRSAAQMRKRRKIQRDSIVGRRNTGTESRKPTHLPREYGDLSSDDEMMEETLPDYLKRRRGAFDKKREQLLEPGLKLPPDFDNVGFSDDEQLNSLIEKPSFSHAKHSRKYEDIQLPYSLGLIPAPIAQWLRDYQVEGVSFLHELFVYQKGGILGDDMGLGKTVQVIAFLTAAYGKTGDERDAKRMRKMRRKRENYVESSDVNWMNLIDGVGGMWDVYHGESKDAALKSASDRKSETAKAMNELNALCRIGLTGTAIQNKYEELWTLLNWTNPGQFGPISTWKSTICEPLKVGQSHDATIYQLSRARKTARKLVKNLLPAFFLRRMKSLIADQLPKKSDRVVFCPLTETQSDAYENFLNSDIIDYIKNSSDYCSCGSGKKAGWCCRMFLPQGGKWQSYVFPAISNLQKISNHLAILIPQPMDPKDKQAKDLEMLQVAVPDQWRELYRTRGSIINYSNPEFCGKWKVLKKLLKWWHANGDKVLVFSHNVRLLKMLQMLFNHTSYNVSYLDGSMSYEDRSNVVNAFNSDPRQFVFLISTKAGGVGLNITSANKVVVVDPNWNPAYDLQAQDRAYRIGQLRDVEVFRLVSAGTIEEIVYARQIYKQQQANIGYNASTERRYFRGVQEKKDQKGEIFGLANLFEYQNNNVVLRDIVNKTNIAESKAGVQVIDFEMEGGKSHSNDDREDDKPHSSTPDENDDLAMSQLAALVRGEGIGEESKKLAPTLKHDPIQAILAGAGVEYTHENTEVVGSSKVEAQLSRRAELVNDGEEIGEEQVFRPESREGKPSSILVRGKNGQSATFKYHPPPEVMKRQFCSMAARYGFRDVTEFALTVEGLTPAQRRTWLENWYKERREKLLGGRNLKGS
ncbi:chromatin-remodeling complex ATPase chain isw-1 [Nannizzia gypsea CBS 118893]|uniref:Chromatin-remodeling complex ATPase chain isw-1 n=1 Tax=Arthroderma gypseum (strain ATCC MYA-4604 / CBS 118893) TaxID=535722 RepID=E4UP05_ARTGP|nr:chromatin-remodeling complex ATPase chain isw-1 [Nannizzia gypsea CBS 118893]EFQ99758.1 chromatin-remodeling complex ATPase chain isw-1 [Nannizzia gypsea CBS 118893]